jgi:hypothetical protein
MEPASLKKYTVLSLFFTAAALLALIFPSGRQFGLVLTLIYAAGNGWLIGRRLFPDEPRTWRIFFGLSTLAAGTAVVGGVLYHLYRFDALAAAVTVLVTPPLLLLLPALKTADAKAIFRLPSPGSWLPAPRHQTIDRMIGWSAGAASLLVAIFGFTLLAASSTEDATRSPWDAVPPMFFAVFFMAALLAVASALSGRLAGFSTVPVSALALLMTGVAATVYAVGFGFDPFIHGVAEDSILKTGVMLPKTPYYTGQYVLVVIIAKLTGLTLLGIDRWLVPVAFAAAVPCAYWGLKRAFGWQPWQAAFASTGLLLIPASQFIMTTPQGLANAVVLATAFLTMPSALGEDRPSPLLPILASAALITHPLAGIPAAAFVAMVFVFKSGVGKRKAWMISSAVAVVAALAVPIAFLVGSGRGGAEVILQGSGAGAAEAVVEGLKGTAVEARRFLGMLDFVYFWRNIRQPLILAMGAAGLVIIMKKRRDAAVFAISFAACLASFAILRSSVSFQSLISYERTNYADRLIELAVVFIAPLALYAAGLAAGKVRRGPAPVALGMMVLVAAVATSSLYLAYPRRDRFESSRGWSTSGADVEAVRLIEKDASGKPYIVLANQSVSAAAIREFGFSDYYDWQDPTKPEKIFYYPVPTGGPLYAYFLKANDEFGSRDTVLAAMGLAKVDTAYFVVNHYWWQAGRTVSSAKEQADTSWNIDNRDFVFRYDRE